MARSLKPVIVVCDGCWRVIYRTRTTRANRDIERERIYRKCNHCQPPRWDYRNVPIEVP